MQLVLCDRGSEPFLIQELRRAYPHAVHHVHSPGLVASDSILQPEAPPILVFARQLLPEAQPLDVGSIKDWARLIFEALNPVAELQLWQLHIVPHYGSGD